MRPARIRWVVAPLLLCANAVSAHAQRVLSQPERVISVSKGASALLTNPLPIQRLSVGDPGIAEALVLSPREVLINGKGLGTTTLFLWDSVSSVKVYSIEVTADAPGLERYLRALMPQENIEVSASGNSVTLSGTVKDPNSVVRAVDVAKLSGAQVIDNLVAPPAVQVMLKVRFAEVNRTAARKLASQLRTLNPQDLNVSGDWSGSTSPDGLIQFLLSSANANIQAFIQAAKSKGIFRTLAEPTLMALPGKEAYFLAGGRFPFPTIQSGGGVGFQGITIVFEEFGVKLRFTPNITRSGAIRLKLEPEVSSLDFANGLVISGFQIPTILTRKASTEVELREGQFLVIAGLLDNSLTDNATKIPILGDIPILGMLFRSKDVQQRRSELLVMISPKLVMASDTASTLPTGEPATWKWDGSLKGPVLQSTEQQQQRK
jgi:pilus assembly protein CpaC